MSDLSDLELLGELGVELEAEKPKTYSPQEARLIAGFEDILKFTEDNGRSPQHGEARDIFERLYAVRLDQLRKNPQALSLLENMDSQGLLKKNAITELQEPDDAAAEGRSPNERHRLRARDTPCRLHRAVQAARRNCDERSQSHQGKGGSRATPSGSS